MIAAKDGKTFILDSVTALQQQMIDEFLVKGEVSCMSGAISLKPSDATQGGAIIESGDVLIESVRTCLWDYNGKVPKPVPALAVAMDAGDAGKFVQYYSAGSTEYFVPSDDNLRFVPVGEAKGINANTNAMLFLVGLVNAGFPEDKIGEQVNVFDGTRAHMHSVPQPKRSGLTGTKDGATVLVADKILALPWENGASAKTAKATTPKATAPKATAPSMIAGGSAAAAPASAAVDPNSPIFAQAQEGMINILASMGGQIDAAAIASKAFSLYAKDPNRNAIVQLIYKPEFLGMDGQPWAFDGKTVKLG